MGLIPPQFSAPGGRADAFLPIHQAVSVHYKKARQLVKHGNALAKTLAVRVFVLPRAGKLTRNGLLVVMKLVSFLVHPKGAAEAVRA